MNFATASAVLGAICLGVSVSIILIAYLLEGKGSE